MALQFAGCETLADMMRAKTSGLRRCGDAIEGDAGGRVHFQLCSGVGGLPADNPCCQRSCNVYQIQGVRAIEIRYRATGVFSKAKSGRLCPPPLVFLAVRRLGQRPSVTLRGSSAPNSLLQFPNATEFMDNGNIRCSALCTHAHRFVAAAAEPGAAASFGHLEQSCFDRLAGGLPRQRDDYSLNSSGTPCSHQNPALRHIVGTEHHRLD